MRLPSRTAPYGRELVVGAPQQRNTRGSYRTVLAARNNVGLRGVRGVAWGAGGPVLRMNRATAWPLTDGAVMYWRHGQICEDADVYMLARGGPDPRTTRCVWTIACAGR